MLELDLQPTKYDIVAMIDGCVLEIFEPMSDDSKRAHVKYLSVSVSDPDKKGRRDVTVKRGPGMRFLLFGKLDDAAFEVVRPLFDALRNAGVRSGA